MAGKKLTVVISQAQGKHPVRSKLEEEVAGSLLMDPRVSISLIPNLYDMAADHTGLVFLRSLKGPFVLLGWQYPRALHWTLDRQQIPGHEGVTELIDDADEDEEELETEPSESIGSTKTPNRNIYCIDMRVSSNPQEYVDEIHRIFEEENQQPEENDQLVQLSFNPTSNGNRSTNGSSNGSTNGAHSNGSSQNGNSAPLFDLTQFILDPAKVEAASPQEEIALLKSAQPPIKRRWYPVIDYSRCTNCMECIDFCLFGVYGVDSIDRILVEEQDNCKKGCPACSRVCPENAIIFPGHKTPAIAGAEGEVAGLKIDLSKLFGGSDEDAVDLAVRERDAELMADGRELVGKSVGLSERYVGRSDNRERDDLDDLMDELDDLGI
ncbi:4Fe-4S binding domain protein [Polystyrenella longa]|uniref:4Fe-4S binding domain protein n=1 Tax=Polystyrenella longa TaxID=2528007 RepID=A0A518CRK5_9PLAN|nr:ferredoxin family protein [Polystyrenella longa]QDU81848.1 4Fe-4S binding domain protein [Polystyrenella longa]